MPVLSARQLHNETSAVLDEVSKGKTFQIVRHGKLIGTLQPAVETAEHSVGGEWDEIMAEVWAAHKKVSGKTPNPVLVERERRRR